MPRILKKIIFCSLSFLFITSLAHANYQAHTNYLMHAHDKDSARRDRQTSWSYTLLSSAQYHKIVAESRAKISNLLSKLNAKQPLINPESLSKKRSDSMDHYMNPNARIAFIAQHLADIPYLHHQAMGEGDWQPDSSVYQPGALHIQQNPVYRLDGLDCQTFVQVAMATFYSQDLSQFDRTILKIAYGAAGNPNGEIVRYYNRNNFVDADFNPVNQRNGWLSDVTSHGPLSWHAKTTQATVTRQQWFLQQQKNLAETVQVLKNSSGEKMANRFMTNYAKLNFPHFATEEITVSYLPREKLAIPQKRGGYKPNQTLLDKIPTPAIAEIVRDVNRWNYYGKKIKDLAGSEFTISHLGLLYRKTFHQGELIYRKITCNQNDTNKQDKQDKKSCEVKPIICQKKICPELMFVHATNAYPLDYIWQEKSKGNYSCSAKTSAISAKQPSLASKSLAPKSTSCNRVVSMPFYDYLTDYQSGSYWNMEMWSILGVHIEKLN